MMRVIGLTGGIGSGKSTISRFLADLGAVIIDADKIGHEVYLPDTGTWRKLVKTFGIDASRLESDGLGVTQPIAPNDTPENKALNRRVEFIKL